MRGDRAANGIGTPLHKEAWYWMKVWYRAAVDRAPPFAWVTLKRIMAECVDIYSQVPPPGENSPVQVNPSQVIDSVPTEDKIKWSVRRLRNNRSRLPLEMRAEHLKGWLA